MSKVYRGYELIKAIADGEIKDGAKIIPHYPNNNCTVEYFIYEYGFLTAYYENGFNNDNVNVCIFLQNSRTFELIEDETIDIDNINLDKIIKVFEDIEMCLDRLSVKISSAGQGSIDNYLDRYKYDLQAVKQLNKEIKSIKEK